MRGIPELTSVHTDFNEPLPTSRIILKEDEASRLGITNTVIESTLAMRYGAGLPVSAVWDGDYKQRVVLKGEHASWVVWRVCLCDKWRT